MNGFQIDRLRDYTKEEMIQELRRVAELVNGKLTVGRFHEHSRVSYSTLLNHFGCWRTALTQAGLEDRYVKPSQTMRSKWESSFGVSNENMLTRLRAVSLKLHKPELTQREFGENETLDPHAYSRRFGSWRKAMEVAGLAQCKGGRRYSDDECFENLLDVWTYYGRPPKIREMNKSPSKVGSKAYVLRWGGWRRTLYAFVERANSENKEGRETSVDGPASTPPQEQAASKPTNTEAANRQAGLGLRYRVLCRDRFRCVLCGRSPATHPQCVLHVDHVIPFSKGGLTEVGNLRTTCAECNLGKGSKVESPGASA